MLVERNKMFISVMSMMLSDSDEDADVTLVWDWLLHYPKCSREFWVLPMKKNRMTDNVIFVFFGGPLDNIKPNFTDIQEWQKKSMTIHCKSLLLSCKNRTQNFPTIIIPLEKLLVTLSPATYITVMALGDYRRMDQRTWDSSCSTRLVCRWVQDQGGDWGWSLWAICGKKARYFSRKIC